MNTTHDELLALRHDPPAMGAAGAAARQAHFGRQGRLRASLGLDADAKAHLERAGAHQALDAWPAIETLQSGDAIALRLDNSDEGARAWVDYLDALAARDIELSIAPYTREAAGTFRLWALSAARIRLPARHRVEARHDLIGIRLAQVGIGFGADSLAGPVDEDRHLPLAGMTRPNENTRAGLSALMELAGLEPDWS